MAGTLFILSAPSGAGKTTLLNATLEKVPTIKRVVTYVTRQPRMAERDGHDYFFISAAEFKQKIKKGFFIEYSTAYGTYYGSPASIIDRVKQGESLALIVDRIGARAIKKVCSAAVLIWVYTSDVEHLKQRLVKRGTELPADIEQRLKLANQEIEEEKKEQLYDIYLKNDEFSKACVQLVEIFLSHL